MSEVHDAATSKRYLEALREEQAENERLRAHIKKCADVANNAAISEFLEDDDQNWWRKQADWHLAALNPTEKVSTNED